jgi:hypothetical protein
MLHRIVIFHVSCVMSERTSMFVPRSMHDTRHAGEMSKMKAYAYRLIEYVLHVMHES